MLRNLTSRLSNRIRQQKLTKFQSYAVRSLSTQQMEKLPIDEHGFYMFPHENGPIVNSPYDNIVIPNLTIDQYVWQSYKNWENRTAAVCAVTGRSYTYAKMRDSCAALAIRLQHKFNLKLGEVVGVCLPNSPEFPIAALGTIEAGLTVTTFNPIYTAEEIARQINDSQAKVMIGCVENFHTISEAVKIAKREIPIICVKLDNSNSLPDGAIDFFEIINTENIDYSLLKKYNINPGDIAFLPYSSGTTGLPKGVMLSHRNILSNCEMVEIEINGNPFTMRTTANYQECLPCVLPFFHIYGLTVTLLSKLVRGAKIVTFPKFKPDLFVNSLAEHKGTLLHLVPPIIIFLGHYEHLADKHIASIRAIFSGAAPIGATDVERLLKKIPKSDFLQGYGLTESSPVVLMNRLDKTNYASVGCPTPATQAKIVDLSDPTNAALDPHKSGELLVRGPQIMKGYLNNKKATDEVLIENGWMRTGDIGFYDEAGFFQITDRLKELIKVKGFQVPPAELEQVLREHPGVLEVGVVGISHPVSGEVPRAFVVRKPGHSATEKELKEFVANKVAPYKKLDGGVQFIESLPKNPSGKILRRQIKEQYCKQ